MEGFRLVPSTSGSATRDEVLNNGFCVGKTTGYTPTSYGYYYIMATNSSVFYAIKFGNNAEHGRIFLGTPYRGQKGVDVWSNGPIENYSITRTYTSDGHTIYYTYGNGEYNTDNSDLEFFAGSITEVLNYFVTQLFSDTRQWNIKYIPINCSLTGSTVVAGNTEVNVTISPYPNATIVGSTVYYSGGRIDSSLNGNTLTFTTPTFPT